MDYSRDTVTSHYRCSCVWYSSMDQNTTVKDLSWFKSHDQGISLSLIRMRIRILLLVTSTPRLKDLYRHITPQYALKWKVIGTLLGLPSEKLNLT